MAALHHTEHVQQSESRKHVAHVAAGNEVLTVRKTRNQASNSYTCGPVGDVRDSGEVDLIAATQRQVQQVLELLQHREAVGHQQGAVAAEHKSCVQFRSLASVVWLRLISFSFPSELI